MSTATPISDYDAIRRVIEHYVDGAISGQGERMKPAFHDDATIQGYVGPDLFAGPIQNLYDWNDANGPASELEARIAEFEREIERVKAELDAKRKHEAAASALFKK